MITRYAWKYFKLARSIRAQFKRKKHSNSSLFVKTRFNEKPSKIQRRGGKYFFFSHIHIHLAKICWNYLLNLSKRKRGKSKNFNSPKEETKKKERERERERKYDQFSKQPNKFPVYICGRSCSPFMLYELPQISPEVHK